jgi:hypothetical protein
VPIIEKTDVIEDDKEDEVVRVAHFIEAHGQPAHSVREVCRSYYPTKVRHYISEYYLPSIHEVSWLTSLAWIQVDFLQPNGAVITNTVSDGPGMTESDYNMTYTFDWAYDDVVAGSDEHKKLEAQHRSGAQMAVHKSIEALRRMAAAGELD